ncbi:hypothetical protein D805_1172 [Bifidobacterium thermophilum RBL67]|uniref:Uncharacterized protein n=1 Tax=Bifidobacterium thermophilum RBL67 TaxID=1254439 RepID=M4RGX8_9BIFI|nr:hypothetical protein D805_1172 [Bifidobacterium thermophilum RBL67]
MRLSTLVLFLCHVCPPGRLVVCLCDLRTKHSLHITGFLGCVPHQSPNPVNACLF